MVSDDYKDGYTLSMAVQCHRVADQYVKTMNTLIMDMFMTSSKDNHLTTPIPLSRDNLLVLKGCVDGLEKDADGWIMVIKVIAARLIDQLLATMQELDENCRLLGSGGERELALMARLETSQWENADLRAQLLKSGLAMEGMVQREIRYRDALEYAASHGRDPAIQQVAQKALRNEV